MTNISTYCATLQSTCESAPMLGTKTTFNNKSAKPSAEGSLWAHARPQELVYELVDAVPRKSLDTAINTMHAYVYRKVEINIAMINLEATRQQWEAFRPGGK